MLTLLQNVALGVIETTPIQVQAAIAAVQYTHVKNTDGGKKVVSDNAARKSAAGRFAPTMLPTMVRSKPS